MYVCLQLRHLDEIVSKANEGLSNALVHKEDLARHAKQAMRLLNLEKMRVATAQGRVNDDCSSVAALY